MIRLIPFLLWFTYTTAVADGFAWQQGFLRTMESNIQACADNGRRLREQADWLGERLARLEPGDGWSPARLQLDRALADLQAAETLFQQAADRYRELRDRYGYAPAGDLDRLRLNHEQRQAQDLFRQAREMAEQAMQSIRSGLQALNGELRQRPRQTRRSHADLDQRQFEVDRMLQTIESAREELGELRGKLLRPSCAVELRAIYDEARELLLRARRDYGTATVEGVTSPLAEEARIQADDYLHRAVERFNQRVELIEGCVEKWH